MTYVLKASELSDDELSLAVFLQGALNKRTKSVYLDIDDYMEYLSEEREYCGLWELFSKSALLFDGLVVYDYAPSDVSVNMAATICAAENLLGVPRSLLQKAERYGLKVKFDTAEIEGGDAERQRAVWIRCRDRLKKDCLVHQVTAGNGFRVGLRDFALSHGAFTFFARPEEDGEFLSEVLGWADKNIPVYGWTTDELAFVRRLSAFGDYLIPSDWSCNHSYLSGETFRRLRQLCKGEALKAKGDKHYLAIVVSDGDNVQWLERDFARESNYGQRLRRKRDYKMSWTAAPILCKICPSALENIYRKAERDTFVCGVSGIGYTNPMTYPEEYLAEFARRTSEGMEYADMSVLTLLDNIENTKDGNAERRLKYFAERESVVGGIWQLDPDRYESGGGKIFWSKGKPFVSVGISFWHPSCDRAQVDKVWLDGIVTEINGRKADIASEEGYTVLNVHPWSTDMDDLDYVVSRLDKHVEIVYAEELIDLIARNVKH